MIRTCTLVPDGLPAADELPSGPRRILDAAERLLTLSGFSGDSMEDIAVEAGVAQELLHFHVTGRDGLPAAVAARRSALVNAARLIALATLGVGDALVRALVAGHHDTVARRCIAPNCFGEPRADRALAARAYSFAFGAPIGVVAPDRRPERLAGQSYAATSEAMLDRPVAFCAGGLRAMLPTWKSTIRTAFALHWINRR